MLAEAVSLFPYASPVCLHPSFVLDFLFYKTRVYITLPCGAPRQGLLDVVTSNGNSGNGNRTLLLSWHQFLCLDIAGTLCETEFAAQIQTKCNKIATEGDMQVRGWGLWYMMVLRHGLMVL